jgi:putative N6-adenine-specific DNA methylase
MLFQRIQPEEAPATERLPEGMQKVVVKTLQGLEEPLAAELTALGAHDAHPVKRAVECRADKATIYRINYESRLALRVLVHIHGFTAYNEKNLYHAIQEVDWDQYMAVTDSLAVDAIVAGKVFTHSHYTALLTKDAIVDQFRDRFKSRPNVDINNPTLRVSVRINATQCDILLDASGDSLHKRGYRRDSVEAPLNEVLAAGMVALSGWDGTTSFAAPMCGSGTLAIEAAYVATSQPAQFFREAPFGFEKWKDFDKQLWQTVKSTADGRRNLNIPIKIAASDINQRARSATAVNALAAGLASVVEVEKMPFDRVKAPDDGGTLIMNPPYDERLKLSEVEDFYKSIGDTFKKNWPGWSAWIITSNKEALKSVGLRPSRRIPLINGALECMYQRFDMYAGKKYSTQTAEEEEPTPPNI